MYIDTHCHLSSQDYSDIPAVIEDNKKAGVDKMILSGCTRESILESLELVEQYPDLYVTIGYHPSEADITTEDDLLLLEKQLQNPKVVGIGEIGLDYHYGKENIMLQKKLFYQQMKLASRYHMPVVIHSRDATEDTISILKEFSDVIGDIHCFSGSLETAKIYLSMGYYLGIGGVVTFKNSKLGDVVSKIGLHSLLLETDSPYLTPEPYRGGQNSSKYLPYVASKIAELLGVSVEEVASQTLQNTEALFDLDHNL